MPSFWQITQARGLQTQGVWALSPDFTVGKATYTSHAGGMSDLLTAGQIVRIRTDVGNSRDHSKLSAEQAVTITAAP